MSDDEWLREYEEVILALPPCKPIKEWTEDEARAAATEAFRDAPAAIADAGLLAEARREARHAATKRRLDGIRRRRPDLAALIDDDLAWLGRTVVGFDRWPMREQIRHWYLVTGIPDAGTSVKSTRGTSATWPGVREAAFVLLDWHSAARGASPSPDWLARALLAIEPAVGRPGGNGVVRDRKLANYMITAWRNDHPQAGHLNHTELQD